MHIQRIIHMLYQILIYNSFNNIYNLFLRYAALYQILAKYMSIYRLGLGFQLIYLKNNNEKTSTNEDKNEYIKTTNTEMSLKVKFLLVDRKNVD